MKSSNIKDALVVVSAIKTILSKKWYLLGFLALVPLTFLFFVYIPVKMISGNNLNFQLYIFTTRDYLLTTVFSILLSLFLTMQIFVIRNVLDRKSMFTSVTTGGIGSYIAAVGAIFGTAAYASPFWYIGFFGCQHSTHTT